MPDEETREIVVGSTVLYDGERYRVVRLDGEFASLKGHGRLFGCALGRCALAPERKRSRSRGVTGKKADGKRVIDKGDRAAMLLRGANSIDEVYHICEEYGLPGVTELRNKYADLNPGMQRMNMGNRLRAFIKRQEKANGKQN